MRKTIILFLIAFAATYRCGIAMAGDFDKECSYRCDFLDCGPYQADTLTITVKPKLDIVGADQICITNACYLETSPVVSATWTAYDLGNNNAVTATATGTTFSHTFSHKGRYLVTAAHPDYCTEATFVLEVKDTPPAPTVTDLDPHNRHTSCLYGSIALSGTPSEPNYNLVWHPACTTASPQWYSGDSVTMSYQDVVCDVHVYNYDRVLQCRSSNYYIHQVTALAPAPLNFPQNITVCPETIITWDNSNVPDQSSEGVLYEWSIEENKQYCASVYGSQFSSGVTLIINNITPTTFYVKLRRTICGIHLDTMIYINVVGASQTAAPISLDDRGTDTAKASTINQLDCYEGSFVHTVDFIPDFTVVAECDRIRIENNSRYRGPGQTMYIRVSCDCDPNYMTTIQVPVSNTTYTFKPNPSPTDTCTYYFRLVGYGAIGNISPACTLGSATIGTPPLLPGETSQLTIHSANNGNEHNTCDNTPIRLTAHLGYPGSIQSSLWLFGDNSSFNVAGDHIDHTYKSPSQYKLAVAITDNYGCVKNATFSIVSNNNPFPNYGLLIYDPEVCPYFNNRDIGFSPNYSGNTYSWWRLKDPTRIPTGNVYIYSTYQTDDYFVYVINNNYCQKEAAINVTFLNAPTASIYAENFNCCVGNSISLYGEQGASNSNLTYSWSITGPNGFSETYSTPNVTFTAPAVTGTYNVSLTVSNSNCSSTATETITVNAKPSSG